ncbi:hypothetical protein C8Q80DRAFT_1356907 [Daedaleopsis nitida]|nr:hypothetical protein C8Q80DRAFT_1356907 [Daedaleopsis nitida]
MLIVATIALLHAAFSTYEHLSQLKALGRPEGSLPNDIVLEACIALVVGIVGATVRSPALREVTWRSEMKRRSSEEEEDPRMSFATFTQRAAFVFSTMHPASLPASSGSRLLTAILHLLILILTAIHHLTTNLLLTTAYHLLNARPHLLTTIPPPWYLCHPTRPPDLHLSAWGSTP